MFVELNDPQLLVLNAEAGSANRVAAKTERTATTTMIIFIALDSKWLAIPVHVVERLNTIESATGWVEAHGHGGAGRPTRCAKVDHPWVSALSSI